MFKNVATLFKIRNQNDSELQIFRFLKLQMMSLAYKFADLFKDPVFWSSMTIF
jgi:hypothetical protein